MNATGPTTRPALSVSKLRARPLDPVAPRLRFLGGLNPADPLIAREGRNTLPCRSRRWGRSKDFSQIRWHSVHRSGGDSFFGHKIEPLRSQTRGLAERVGFEPTLPFRVNTLSKRAPSATRPSLRIKFGKACASYCSETLAEGRRARAQMVFSMVLWASREIQSARKVLRPPAADSG